MEGEYIELIQLLKATQIAQSGGHAKMMVENKEIIFQNAIETRKRAKIRKGEQVQVKDTCVISVE